MLEPVSKVLAFLYPDVCRVCQQPLKELNRIPVCHACLEQPEPLSADYFCVACRTPFSNRFPLDEQGRCALCRSGQRGFDAAYSYGAYEGTLRSLIHLLKYSYIPTLAVPLADYLVWAVPREEKFDAVVPLPLHWLRHWRRGFNQAELLANQIARRTGIPMLSAVRRTKSTRTQAGLSNSRRRANVSGAFRVRRGESVAGKRILLVDDVMTTGSTASSCATALKRAGAKYVALLTLARVDRQLGPGMPSAKNPNTSTGVLR